jgi:serine/threonine protein phosphatase PrpC
MAERRLAEIGRLTPTSGTNEPEFIPFPGAVNWHVPYCPIFKMRDASYHHYVWNDLKAGMMWGFGKRNSIVRGLILDNLQTRHVSISLKTFDRPIPGIQIIGRPGQSLFRVYLGAHLRSLISPTQTFWQVRKMGGGSAGETYRETYDLFNPRLTQCFIPPDIWEQATYEYPNAIREGPSAYAPYYGWGVLMNLIMMAFDRELTITPDHPLPTRTELVRLEVQHLTDSMKPYSTQNEDRMSYDTEMRDGLYVAGIFDGHCGSAVAEMLARDTRAVFREEFDVACRVPNARRADAVRESMRLTVLRLESRAYDMWLKHWGDRPRTELETSGACLNLVVIDSYAQQIHCANCGDSFAGVVLTDGTIRTLSSDHNGDSLVEQARVFAAGGFIGYNPSRVMGFFMPSRSIGDFDLKYASKEFLASYTAEPEMDSFGIDFAKVHAVFLATDGLVLPNPPTPSFVESLMRNQLEFIMDEMTGPLDDRSLIYITFETHI